MAGKLVPYDQTYLTAAQAYRNDISVADPSPYLDNGGATIPDIRLDIDPSKQAIDPAVKYAPKFEISSRAYNSHLELYIHLDGVSEAPYRGLEDGLLPENSEVEHANIKVWAWSGTGNDGDLPEGNQGRWCLVHEQSIVDDTLVVLRNIPNTKYRVTVSELSDGISVAGITQQHTI